MLQHAAHCSSSSHLTGLDGAQAPSTHELKCDQDTFCTEQRPKSRHLRQTGQGFVCILTSSPRQPETAIHMFRKLL